MKSRLAAVLIATTTTLCGCAAHRVTSDAPAPRQPEGNTMHLGAFSVSLAVKDLEASRAFYKTLGFEEAGGDATQNWLVLRNATTTIGLFQGMFDDNILTFNPGWNHKAEPLQEFQDIRELQRILKDQGVALITEADESTSGPASVVLQDPDGNQILIDQHVPSPTK